MLTDHPDMAGLFTPGGWSAGAIRANAAGVDGGSQPTLLEFDIYTRKDI